MVKLKAKPLKTLNYPKFHSKMKIQTLNKSETEMSFILQDSNPVTANTLRRIMTVEVPTLAIDEITFIKNDAALYDEMLAHRIGLIPLKTDLKTYEEKEKCTCKGEGCAKCQVILTLKVTGPGNIYSESLQAQDPKVIPTHKDLLLVKLIKDQEIELQATAILAKGKEHVKHCPGIITYKSLPSIKINNKTLVEQAISQLKDQVSIQGTELKIKHPESFNVELLESLCKDAITINYSKKDHIFTIESFGQLTPKEILDKSIDVLNEKLDEFSKELKESKVGKLATLTKKIKK